jgi:hypothetical protein
VQDAEVKGAVAAFLVVLVLGSAAAWWLQREAPLVAAPQTQTDVSPAPPRNEKPLRDAEIGTAAPESAPLENPATAASKSDLRSRLLESRDYFEVASNLIDAAKQGDASAQYYLSRALGYCESLYDWYFITYGPNGAAHRTLDEALQLTASRPVFTPDDVRDIQSRCQKLRRTQPPPFGTSQEWQTAALAAGFPLAQVQSALNLALQGRERGQSDKAVAARDEARRLALESLRTTDPLVIAQMGDVAANLAGDNQAEARKQQWAWPLAACLREAGCDSMIEWMRIYCNIDMQCQPFETPVDVIRRKAGNDYDEIERRAREINQKLDAGTLEEGDI